MLDLDKIRSIQSLPRLSFEDSKLAIFTRLHKYEDALPLVLAEVACLRSELAAAQAGPVVEWRKAEQWEEVDIGRFSIAVSDAGWSVEIKGHSGMYELIDRGPETGPAGKAAAEAAYRRACGFPGR